MATFINHNNKKILSFEKENKVNVTFASAFENTHQVATSEVLHFCLAKESYEAASTACEEGACVLGVSAFGHPKMATSTVYIHQKQRQWHKQIKVI